MSETSPEGGTTPEPDSLTPPAESSDVPNVEFTTETPQEEAPAGTSQEETSEPTPSEPTTESTDAAAGGPVDESQPASDPSDG